MPTLEFGPGPTFGGIVPEDDFGIVVTSTPLVVGGSTALVSEDDHQNAVTTDAAVDGNFRLTATASAFSGGVAFSTQTPAVCSVDAEGNVARIADGEAVIEASARIGKRIVRRSIARAGGATHSEFDSWLAGSAARAAHDAILTRIQTKTPQFNTTQLLATITNNSPAAPAGSWNPAFFAADLNWSALALVATKRGVVMLTDRHGVYADHTLPNNSGNGDTVCFLGTDGQWVSRTIQSSMNIAGTDIGICRLSAPVPATVTPMRIMPANWRTKFPTMAATAGVGGVIADIPHPLPAIYFHPWAQLLALAEERDTPGLVTQRSVRARPLPANSAFAPFFAWNNSNPAMPEVSNTPLFLLIPDGVTTRPVLLGVAHASGLYFPSLASHIADIQSAMNALSAAAGEASPNYTVTAVDLSSYTTF